MSKYAISLSGVEGETYMARARSPERDKAFELYKQSKGERQLKDIASELEVSDTQVRKWKNLDKWEELLNGNVPKSKGNVPNEKKKQIGAPKGNQRAKGNKGNSNPKNQFTHRNTASLKHGLFSRYIPESTQEIMNQVAGSSPADIIWFQIELQFAAIIRAQQIMFVKDKDDITKELKREKRSYSDTGSSSEEEYEIQFAWDKHATFLNSQSRAMSELRSAMKQFKELAYDDDERLLKLEQMQVGIEKTKVEIEKISNGGDDDGPIEIVISSKKSV